MRLWIPYIMPAIIMAFLTSCTQKDYTTILNPGFTQPEISITMPVPGDTLRGLVAISVQDSSGTEISQVQFYVDGILPDSLASDSSIHTNTCGILRITTMAIIWSSPAPGPRRATTAMLCRF